MVGFVLKQILGEEEVNIYNADSGLIFATLSFPSKGVRCYYIGERGLKYCNENLLALSDEITSVRKLKRAAKSNKI